VCYFNISLCVFQACFVGFLAYVCYDSYINWLRNKSYTMGVLRREVPRIMSRRLFFILLLFCSMHHDVRSLSDRELLDRCERFGREALVWRNRFRALLPEVERRGLWKKKGYGSIVEFGKRLAGLSEAQVRASLNIAPRLEDKPELRKLLESGEVSINKITPIMSMVTKENESELATQVRVLSLGTIKALVRDVKLEHLVDQKSKIVVTPETNEFGLNEEVAQRLRELKAKGIDINEALMNFLDQREEYVTEQKEKVRTSLPETSTRYIPARVKKIIKQEHGTKCAKQGCMKPSREIHHAARYSLTQSHDPNFMAPLCKEHHELAHSIDVRYREMRRG